MNRFQGDTQAPLGPQSPDGPGLSIGDLAARTGVSVTTLRMWEARHGYPVPHRLPSGHRRYTERDEARVRAVVELRDSGRTLASAIPEIFDGAADGDVEVSAQEPARGSHRQSVFAQVRRMHPGLATYELKRSTLLGMSWAIEDECCARADRAHVFGAFEQQRYLEGSRARWVELAKVAASAHVYAIDESDGAPLVPGQTPDSPSVALVHSDSMSRVGLSDPGGSLYRVGLDDQHPLRTEWIVICDSAELPAALIARETPGPRLSANGERRFESIITVDPEVVRDAARLCAAVADDAGSPRAGALVEELRAAPAAPSAIDLPNLARLLGRLVSYVDAGK